MGKPRHSSTGMAVVLAESLALIEYFRAQISSQNRGVVLAHQTSDLQKCYFNLERSVGRGKIVQEIGFTAL